MIDIELMIMSIFFEVSAGMMPSQATGVSTHSSFASAHIAFMNSTSQPSHLPLASGAVNGG
ncbi:hypothetical protein D9M72_408880 [compost metagenome]